MVPLYMDEHVPRGVTLGLRLKGVDVVTVQEDGLSGVSDPELLDRARDLKRAVFTNDRDLLSEASKRQHGGVGFSGVIFAHHGRISIGQCVRDLELVSTLAEGEDLVNQVVFLPL